MPIRIQSSSLPVAVSTSILKPAHSLIRLTHPSESISQLRLNCVFIFSTSHQPDHSIYVANLIPTQPLLPFSQSTPRSSTDYLFQLIQSLSLPTTTTLGTLLTHQCNTTNQRPTQLPNPQTTSSPAHHGLALHRPHKHRVNPKPHKILPHHLRARPRIHDLRRPRTLRPPRLSRLRRFPTINRVRRHDIRATHARGGM